MSQPVGKAFESDFRVSCPDHIFIYRIPDVKYGVKSLCDFIVFRQPRLYLFELKSTKEKTFPVRNIADHQLENMSLMNQLDGVVSGMIINFRMHDKTYFIRGDKLKEYVDLGNSRVSVEWLETHGILIHQVKKRTRFRYDYEFLERIL